MMIQLSQILEGWWRVILVETFDMTKKRDFLNGTFPWHYMVL